MTDEAKAERAAIADWIAKLEPEHLDWLWFGEFDDDFRIELANAIRNGKYSQ